jgi:hypothetical protein
MALVQLLVVVVHNILLKVILLVLGLEQLQEHQPFLHLLMQLPIVLTNQKLEPFYQN